MLAVTPIQLEGSRKLILDVRLVVCNVFAPKPNCTKEEARCVRGEHFGAVTVRLS